MLIWMRNLGMGGGGTPGAQRFWIFSSPIFAYSTIIHRA